MADLLQALAFPTHLALPLRALLFHVNLSTSNADIKGQVISTLPVVSSSAVQCAVQMKNWLSYNAELNRNLKNFTLVAAEDSEGLNHLLYSVSCVLSSGVSPVSVARVCDQVLSMGTV